MTQKQKNNNNKKMLNFSSCRGDFSILLPNGIAITSVFKNGRECSRKNVADINPMEEIYQEAETAEVALFSYRKEKIINITEIAVKALKIPKKRLVRHLDGMSCGYVTIEEWLSFIDWAKQFIN